MSSILLPVGQCGNQIGNELMTLIDKSCDSAPLSHRDKKLRCVCVDSEPKVISSNLRSDRRHGQLYRDSNMIVGQRGRGNNFALGYHGISGESEDTSLLNLTMDAFRKEVERCDCFAGTMVMHSLTGGTGSGLGSRLVETLRDAYPLAHVMSVAVSPHMSGDSPLQHYNSLLSLAALQRSADGILLFSNDDVLKHLVAYRGHAVRQPTGGSVSMKDMNHYIATSLAGILQPLGEKTKTIKGATGKNKNKSMNSDRSILSSSISHRSTSKGERSFRESTTKTFNQSSRSIRSSFSKMSCSSNMSRISNSSLTFDDDDDSCTMMQHQPRATASALLRYRGITSDSKEAASQHRDVEAISVPKGNEPWEMLRSICPEPSKKFATIHHIEKPKVSWENLSQSLLHSMCRYDKNGKQFSTLAALLIARGDAEKSFADSATKIEERLKTSLGCVDWNPFPVDFWISQHCVAGSANAQSLTLCLNTSRIIDILDDVTTKAKTMFDAGAYLHWFEKHGCTKHDFLDAFETLENVVEEYRYAVT